MEARRGKELIDASRPFAVDAPMRSWWYLLSTLAILAGLLTAAVVAPWWPLRLAVSALAGCVIVRGFILYHDYMHGATSCGSPRSRRQSSTPTACSC